MKQTSLPKARPYSKVMGLQALKELTRGIGSTLPFQVVKAREAEGKKIGRSLKALVGPEHERVQIRVDPKGRGPITERQWNDAPRTFVELDRSDPGAAEEGVRRWVRAKRDKGNKKTVFILHALKPFSQYDRQGQVTYNGENGFIVFQHGKMRNKEDFRGTPMPLVVMDLDGGVKSSHGSPEIPEALKERVMGLIGRIRSAYPKEKHFELRFVTYKGAKETADKPEYYDLIFGKRGLEIGWLETRYEQGVTGPRSRHRPGT